MRMCIKAVVLPTFKKYPEMKCSNVIFALVCLTLISSSALAQVLSGNVKDASGDPIDYVIIDLIQDSTSVQKVFTDEEGEYIMPDVKPGRYLIKASSPGIKTVYSPPFSMTSSGLRVPTIVILDVIKLDEAVVSGERQVIELKADKKVFNVDKSLMSAAGTAEDILKQVPSVNVSNDGEVSLRGKTNVLILIDGKQSSMFGTTNADIVQQLPAGSIERVEVMTNPSSKYDAQGMGGIINIILKRADNQSKQGSLTLGAGTGDRYNGSLLYNVSKGRTKIGFNLNSRNSNKDDYFFSVRTIDDPYINLNTTGDHEKRRTRSFANMSLEQRVRESDVFSISVQGSYNDIRNDEINNAYYLNTDLGQDSSLYRRMPFHVNPHGIGTNIAYKWTIDDRQKIAFSNDFNHYWAERSQSFLTQKFNGENEQIGVDTTQEVMGSGRYINDVAQMDYDYQVSEPFSLEAGLKYQFSRFRSQSLATKVYTQYEEVDSILTNSFDYDRNFFAAYTNLKYKFDEKWSGQIGLRYENFSYNGTSISVENPIKISYQNLFPSVFLSYLPNEENAFQLNYSRRVNRPNFFQLFPYVNLSDPLNIRVGNPALEPEFIHIAEFSYGWKKPGHQLISTLYTQYTTGLIQRIYTYNADGSSVLMPFNLNSSLTYGLDLTHVWTWEKIGDWTFNFNAFNTQINGDNIGTDVGNSGASWFMKSFANFSVIKNLKLQWTINYLAEAAISQGVREPQFWTDLGAKYSMLDGKLDFTLNANDIFNTYRTVTEIDTEGLYQRIDRKPNSRYLQLSVTWNFIRLGESGNSRRGRGSSGGLKDRNGNFNPGGGSDNDG